MHPPLCQNSAGCFIAEHHRRALDAALTSARSSLSVRCSNKFTLRFLKKKEEKKRKEVPPPSPHLPSSLPPPSSVLSPLSSSPLLPPKYKTRRGMRCGSERGR